MQVIEREELLTLVPHKGSMFLLSRVTAVGEEVRELTAEYDISDDCLFFDATLGGVPSWVGFECMAQCISALSGLEGRMRGQQPRIGCILSVSNLNTTAAVLPTGTTTCISVREDCRVDDVYTFDGVVTAAGHTVVQAKLTVMDVADITMLN